MTIVFAILIFSFLIFIHELGHFLSAKAFGVQVNEFSLFMGPAIWKKQVGDTLYALRCIPIGGYCAMEGEEQDTDNPRSFQKAAWWKRLIILCAGAAMNFIAGFLIMVLVFAPTEQFVMPIIADYEEGCTIIGDDGLQVGDRILSVDGEAIYVQSDFSLILSLNAGDIHDLVVERDGEKVYLDNFVMEKHLFGDETTERYGFTFSVEDANAWNTLCYACAQTMDTVRLVRLSLQMLFTGQASVSDVTGPVGIVSMMSEVASESASALDAVLNVLYLGGFIAINLAVMNMLPIPALDGGRVFFLLITTAIEAVTHKKVDPKYEAWIHGAGMVVLLIIMALIMFKDVFTIFWG